MLKTSSKMKTKNTTIMNVSPNFFISFSSGSSRILIKSKNGEKIKFIESLFHRWQIGRECSICSIVTNHWICIHNAIGCTIDDSPFTIHVIRALHMWIFCRFWISVKSNFRLYNFPFLSCVSLECLKVKSLKLQFRVPAVNKTMNPMGICSNTCIGNTYDLLASHRWTSLVHLSIC